MTGPDLSNDPFAFIAAGILLILLGGLLALDVKGISSWLQKNSYTPFTRKQGWYPEQNLNAFKIVGNGFCAGGIIFLVVGVVHAFLPVPPDATGRKDSGTSARSDGWSRFGGWRRIAVPARGGLRNDCRLCPRRRRRIRVMR